MSIAVFNFGKSDKFKVIQAHIVGNFRGRKLSRIGEKYDFRGENVRELVKNMIFVEETFADCSPVLRQGRHAPKFRGENFRK